MAIPDYAGTTPEFVLCLYMQQRNEPSNADLGAFTRKLFPLTSDDDLVRILAKGDADRRSERRTDSQGHAGEDGQ
jgi:hypothetical protein